MNETELKIWAATYIEAQEQAESIDEHHPLWWAVGKFIDLEYDDPESCWRCILEVLSHQPSQQVIGMIAAGPMEELIHLHGPTFIDRIEDEAKRNAIFRDMLGGVWESGDEDIWNRVCEVRGKAR